MDPTTRDRLRAIRAIANQLSDLAFAELDPLDDDVLGEVAELLSRDEVLDHLAEGERSLYVYIGEAATEVRLHRPARPAAATA